MKIEILGTVNQPVEAFIEWLNTKNVSKPWLRDIPEFHKKWGEKYNVRWDIALIQSCLETNYFKFTGDVDKDQNNFAGIGATGEGVKGERFSNIETGCKAQIQHLATYAGKDIANDELVAQRTKDVKEIIFNKAHTWEELSGRWAADGSYWGKISSISDDFKNWYLVNGSKFENTTPEKTATWLEINKDNAGKTVVIAYKDDIPLALMTPADDKEDFIKVLQRFIGAKSCPLVALAGKKIPNLPEYTEGRESNQQTENLLNGKKIALDVGHGTYAEDGGGWECGAACGNIEEWELNLISAKECENQLKNLGASVSLFTNEQGSEKLSLGQKGRRATGHDVFVSFHHNSCESRNAQGTETLIHTVGTAEDDKLANCIQKRVLESLQLCDRDVYRQQLGVLNTVPPTVKACCLTEGFFITGPLTEDPKEMALKEGKAIAQGILDYLNPC
jgi:N-acetylmuramoyl-L-alanine amidase